MPRHFSELCHTQLVWQESLSASSRTGPSLIGGITLGLLLFSLKHVCVCVCVCMCVQERRGVSIPRLNPFLRIETSHASLDFKALSYPEATEALIPQHWPRNSSSHCQNLRWRNLREEEPHTKPKEDSRMEPETNIQGWS